MTHYYIHFNGETEIDCDSVTEAFEEAKRFFTEMNGEVPAFEGLTLTDRMYLGDIKVEPHLADDGELRSITTTIEIVADIDGEKLVYGDITYRMRTWTT